MKLRFLAVAITLVAAIAVADEGMWMPQQMPDLAPELKKLGIRIDPNRFADLTGDPMGAVVSLGGCSASFVSPQGLIVTNHHCAYGSIQFNSTAQNDLITNGFLAKTLGEEVPAAPGARVFVTTGFEDVTSKISGNIGAKVSDAERARTIDRRIKAEVAACEKTPGVRCRVASYYEGALYQKITQMEIRDVRLVYAPPRGIGEYGGEIDNWMWPRHTGDWAFLRAYVSPEGKPADYSKDNVPFQPKHYLRVSNKGMNEGDLVIVAGYPGMTYRYRTSHEVRQAAEVTYPTTIRYSGEVIRILEEASKQNAEARILNAGRIKGFANGYKNNQGMLAGIVKSDLVGQRQQAEAELTEWIKADPKRVAKYGTPIEELRAIQQRRIADAQRGLVTSYLVRSSPTLGQGTTLYRLSIERPKKDADRKSGYQERDFRRIAEGVRRAQRSMEPVGERAALEFFLMEASRLPAEQRIAAVDRALAATGEATPEAQVKSFVDQLFTSKLTNVDERLKMMEETTAQLDARKDPMLSFAGELTKLDLQGEKLDDELTGATARVRPRYMTALREMRGGRLYPDANSTLRITFGTVRGYQPRDAVAYDAQTSLAGVIEKDTGVEPFDSPKALLVAAKEGRTEGYIDADLKDVPVNFLSDVDTTGGNSGSATLNADGELCGLLFDGIFEGMAGDYFVEDKTSRSIHVDAVYMLWVMDAVDGAHNLLREMNLPVRFAN